VEELYNKIKEILEEDGKGETNTIILGDCNSVIGVNHTKSSLDHMVEEE
jgi:hypothetical protein